MAPVMALVGRVGVATASLAGGPRRGGRGIVDIAALQCLQSLVPTQECNHYGQKSQGPTSTHIIVTADLHQAAGIVFRESAMPFSLGCMLVYSL